MDETEHIKPENKRINEIRSALGLTLEKFGSKLGVTKVAISNIEKGNRNVTEQMRKAICREFNVDYMWLTTGDGEMFIDANDDFTAAIDSIMADETDFRRKLFKSLVLADEEDLKGLEKWIDFCAGLKTDEPKKD